jgi:hypothetical protein
MLARTSIAHADQEMTTDSIVGRDEDSPRDWGFA